MVECEAVRTDPCDGGADPSKVPNLPSEMDVKNDVCFGFRSGMGSRTVDVEALQGRALGGEALPLPVDSFTTNSSICLLRFVRFGSV